MKRVFISFRHEDKPPVNGLRLLAANDKFDIEFYDESLSVPIKSENAAKAALEAWGADRNLFHQGILRDRGRRGRMAREP